MREKHDDQVKLNFTLSISLASLSISLINTDSAVNSIRLTCIQSQTDINNIFEKYSLRLKRFDIVYGFENSTSSEAVEKVIITSDQTTFNPNMYLNFKVEAYVSH